jgi:HD-GYP domain-containing protein (c-di-GMP phosphodiesterase class II)/PAS domain-containing protein
MKTNHGAESGDGDKRGRIAPSIFTYGVAVLAVIAATFILFRMQAVWQDAARVSLFLAAVVFSAWFGGIGPGLLATVLSGLAFDYYFLVPAHSPAVGGGGLPGLLIFVLAALFTTALSTVQRRETESLRRAGADLKRDNLALQAEITEHRQGEAAIRKSEQVLREAETLGHTGSWEHDLLTGKIFNTEENLHLFFGNDLSKGAPFDDYAQAVHPDDRDYVLQRHEQLLEGGPGDIEYRVVWPDGSVHVIFGRATVVRDAQGRAVRVYGTNLDVTERKRAEEKIQQQIERLTGLREVDQLISSTFDLQISLSMLLSHAARLLAVDAAAVLLLNAVQNVLEYRAGFGFRTNGIQNARVQIGNSLAGRVAMDRRIVQVRNAAHQPDSPLLADFLKAEDFVSYSGAPLIIKGKVIGVLEVFHRSLVPREQDWLEFFSTIAAQAAILVDNTQLFNDLEVSNMELSLAYEATIEGWSHALDLRDKETEGHTQRVTDLTMKLSRQMGLADDDLIQLRRGALLHDIGKLGVPDQILFKTGELTDPEWELMRKHPVFAYEMLSPIRYLRAAAIDIPYCHHEKWDGTGYPRGLKGEQIPLAARVFAVVDVWDALTSERPYRPAWTKEAALNHMREESGKHFDPRVIETFLKMIG